MLDEKFSYSVSKLCLYYGLYYSSYPRLPQYATPTILASLQIATKIVLSAVFKCRIVAEKSISLAFLTSMLIVPYLHFIHPLQPHSASSVPYVPMEAL